MKKENEALESHPEEKGKQQAFDDQRNNNSNVREDEEEDGTPVLDEADLEENNISEDDADNVEWNKDKGGQQPQNITNTADRGTDNKGTDDDNRTGSNTMQPQDQPLK